MIIDEILEGFDGNCQCGHGESCEYCNQGSAFFKLRDKLRKLLSSSLRGKPARMPTVEDYTHTLTITENELMELYAMDKIKKDVIKNAVIQSATIKMENHKYLDAELVLNYGGMSLPFGGYGLYLSESFKHHKLLSVAGHFIWRVMEIAGVTEWENIKGKNVRVKINGFPPKIHAIGHIVNDDWFDPCRIPHKKDGQ